MVSPRSSRALNPVRARSAFSMIRCSACSCWIGAISNRLRDHPDRAARALCRAHPAALAVIVFERESLFGTELQNRVVGADAVAVIALEAIAAGEAPARFEERIGLIQTADHFVETG